MFMSKKGFGKIAFGAAIGAGLGLLFAPKKGEETRKELKVKLDDLLKQVKEIDADDVKKEFDVKVAEIKTELADLDKEKAVAIAKEKGKDLKKQAEDLVKLAKEKGTPVLKESAEDLLQTVIKASKEALKKLEDK
ncbi:MAG: YtxH domain-containing protein [Bacilli bacterium]|nr:YtxH domain-containing protein [Bacilli bacterium]